jgi:hypothetical protein
MMSMRLGQGVCQKPKPTSLTGYRATGRGGHKGKGYWQGLGALGVGFS